MISRHQATMATIEQLKADGAIDAAKAEGLLDRKKSYGVTKKQELQQQIVAGDKGVRALLASAEVNVHFKRPPPRGEELNELQKLMTMYRAWARGVAPGKHSDELFLDMRDLNASRLFYAVEDYVRHKEVERATEVLNAPQSFTSQLDPLHHVSATQPTGDAAMASSTAHPLPPAPIAQAPPAGQADPAPQFCYEDIMEVDHDADDCDFDMVDPDGF